MTPEPQAAESRPALSEPARSDLAPARVLPCTRRALLARAGAGGAVLGAAGLLAACGGTGESEGATGSGAGGSAASGSGSSSAAGGGASGGAGGGVAASQVPAGSAVVVEVGGNEVVVAQPSAGTYVAYSAVCTHAGGIVKPEQGTQVRCPLHGSVFDAGKDGEVLQGPATEPLSPLTVTQQGDQLVIS